MAWQNMDPCHKPWRIAMCPWTLMDRTAKTLAVDHLAEDARFAQSVHCSVGEWTTSGRRQQV